MTTEQLAISQLRDKGGWYCGDPRAAEVLAAYKASILANADRDLAAMTQARDDAVAAAHLVAEELATLRMCVETGK